MKYGIIAIIVFIALWVFNPLLLVALGVGSAAGFFAGTNQKALKGIARHEINKL